MAPAASSNPPAYEKNEKALCFHHELLYEAKITDDPEREDEHDKTSPWRYRVHYKGWKNTWDDWVPQERLRKLTEDNRELAASLRRDVMQAENRQRGSKSTTSKKARTHGSEIGSGRGSEERHSSVPAAGRSTKRGRDNDIEKVDTPSLPQTFSRLHVTGSSPFKLPVLLDLPSSASSQETGFEIEASGPKGKAKHGPSLSSRPHKGGVFKLEDAASGKTAAADHGIKTVASRTIHGKYDGEENLVLGKPDVISRRGYFKDGVYSSPQLEAVTDGKLQAGSRPIIRHESSEQPTKQDKPPPGPDQATSADEKSFRYVMDLLSKPPPADEAEHMTFDNFYHEYHWAPLIGGTTENERSQIEDEARQRDLWTASKADIHPQYGLARINDPLNANRLHYFEGQDQGRKLMVAGVPKDPLHLDPPGSGTPFDYLKHPDRLVQLPPRILGALSTADLQQLDRSTIMRFPTAALKMLPPKVLHRMRITIPLENHSNDEFDSQEDSFFARPSVHFTVPDMIKGYLVDDWENVTKSLTLVELPSKAPVNWILDSYFHEEKDKRRLDSADANRLVEIVEGMKAYFDKMLGKTLLYKFEREQYAEVRKLWESGTKDWEGKGPGDCYGAEHLCRLIVSMPEYIAQTNMEAQSVGKIKEEMALLNHWICRSHATLFVNRYERPSAEYIENARD